MNMIEVKTSELIGPALDWAVEVMRGSVCEIRRRADAAHPVPVVVDGTFTRGLSRFSSDWGKTGPLIAEYSISLHCPQSTDDVWAAWRITPSGGFCCGGETPLIAACRAIVAAHSGDVVSVPAELTNQ